MQLPIYLENRLIEEYNSAEIEKIRIGYQSKRKTTFRVNNLKSNVDEIKLFLEKNNILYSCISWYDGAFALESDVDIRTLSIYEEGKIYVQSLSSMLPVIILNPSADESILDMAAAPGSKTTFISSLSNNKTRIMAVEKDKIRCERLKYNINKQGATNITILNQDASMLDDYFRFDKILLDAPCSGSGTITENNVKYFSEKLVDNSVNMQIKLLKKAFKLLKVGGTIVYSTCSILKEENEKVLEEVLKLGNVKIEKIEMKNLPELTSNLLGTISIYPNLLYEGFFIAKLSKIKE